MPIWAKMRNFVRSLKILNMINRELIRQKVVQIAYAYTLMDNHNVDAAEKELLLSTSRAYDLYQYLLSLLLELHRMSVRTLEVRQNRSRRLGEQVQYSSKFVDNRFIAQLEANLQLASFRESQKWSWMDEEEFVRALYNKIEGSELYATYMDKQDGGYTEDRDLWRQIYRQFICNNEDLDELLEDKSLYWNDDKVIVDTFVLKTINRFTEQSTEEQALMPEFRSDNDREFAVRLLRTTLDNAEYYASLVGGTVRSWDMNRIALMDRVILHVGLAEIITFPDIPVSVSINEYVEMTKMYSAPKSAKYVNATLDRIAKQLMAEHKLVKNV